VNYFEVFDLPRILNIDLKALEKKFHELSRQHHPDYYTAAADTEKHKALRMTALLNDAYRTLRNPERRVEYLLTLHGFKPDGSKVPQALLMEVFEINEQLEEVKAGAATPEQVQNLSKQIGEKRAQFDAQLQAAAAEWDNLITRSAPEADLKQQLAKLTEIVSESSYIRNLEEELAEA
jgi:molecular chaperone HscB